MSTIKYTWKRSQTVYHRGIVTCFLEKKKTDYYYCIHRDPLSDPRRKSDTYMDAQPLQLTTCWTLPGPKQHVALHAVVSCDIGMSMHIKTRVTPTGWVSGSKREPEEDRSSYRPSRMRGIHHTTTTTPLVLKQNNAQEARKWGHWSSPVEPKPNHEKSTLGEVSHALSEDQPRPPPSKFHTGLLVRSFEYQDSRVLGAATSILHDWIGRRQHSIDLMAICS